MNANERFEYMADLFYKQTGVVAPGKDSPPGFSSDSDEHRLAAWKEWVERFYRGVY